ncbi:MAG: RibD family protein [Planctomycetaceae bacterium]
MTRGLPWVHAKWAMTLDGKLSTRTGDSKWISSEESRRIAHELRGRMDAIIVGIGTALADDPLLTARPPGPRVAMRVVLDSEARLPIDSQLVRTAARDAPVLVAVGPRATIDRCR